MPSSRFKFVVALMSALTVSTYVAEPVLVAHVPEPRKEAAAFSLATVDGSTFRLADRPNGSLVLLDFMATWCFPCREQAAELVDLRQHYSPDDLAIVSVDEEYSIAAERVLEFRLAFANISASVEAFRWYFAVDTVEGHVGLRYGVTALPTVVLIDGDGRVARTWFGAVSAASLRVAIDAEFGL
jgi:thiol-disulfide isomerase/thioredoxin